MGIGGGEESVCASLVSDLCVKVNFHTSLLASFGFGESKNGIRRILSLHYMECSSGEDKRFCCGMCECVDA